MHKFIEKIKAFCRFTKLKMHRVIIEKTAMKSQLLNSKFECKKKNNKLENIAYQKLFAQHILIFGHSFN